MDPVIEQDAQATWNEIAAERAGDAPVRPAEKPATAPAAIAPQAEVKPEVDFAAKIAEMESKFGDRLRRAEGHFGNLNGEVMSLKSQLDAAKAAAKTTGGPSQAEIKQAAANPAEWDALKVDFPEWATATERLLDARIANGFDAKAFESTIKEQMRGETAAVRKEIVNSSLDAVFPGWEEEVKTEGFNTWVNQQSDAVKALTASDRVGDAAKMLKLYETAKQSNPANQLIEQRKQTLAAATATPKGVRTASAQKSWEDMTTNERWDYEKRQRAKQSR